MAEDDHHEHGHDHGRDHGDHPGPMHAVQDGVRNFFTNWREFDAPVPTKLWLTLRNRGRIVGQLKLCCGHPGQPGC